MGKCHFQDEWLDRKDSNGCKVSDWIKKANKDEALCCVCSRTFSISKGFYAINQHAVGKVHQQNCSVKLSSYKLVPSVDNTIKLYNSNEQARIAELTWALKVVSSNFSAKSSDDCEAVFRKMFPEVVPDAFSIGRTKLGYLLTDALGPFFHEEMLEEVASLPYSIIYDETTNNAGNKVLQVRINYWSEKNKKIISRHLQSFFMGHATAENLKTNLLKSLSDANLPLKNLISVESDGPFVNKKVFRLLNEEILTVRKKGLLDIVTCTIHTVHNSFLKGLEEYGSDASDFIISVYNYFDDWPSRWEDFSTIQEKLKVPTHRFIKHVSSRWLTIEPAANRLLEQWKCLEEYFLRYIPSRKEQKTLNTVSYKRIVDCLNEKTMKCQLLFVISSAKLFSQYTSFFQREDPLIHLIYDKIKGLIIKVAGRICTEAAIKLFKSDVSKDPFESKNLIAQKDIIFNEELQKELLELSEKDKGYFLRDVQHHFISAGTYLLNKGLLQNKVLFYLRCLKPDFANTPKNLKVIAKLAQCLPIDIDIDTLLDEWKIIKLNLEKLAVKRIDTFWSTYVDSKEENGDQKYPNLSIFLKSSLSIYHGSADIERGFSIANRIISEERTSMKERMLNARLNVVDVLKLYSNQAALVPVTNKMIKKASVAHQAYQSYLENEKKKQEAKKKAELELQKAAEEEERKKKEAEKNQKEIVDLEKQLDDLNKNVQERVAVSDQLIVEGHKKLKNALESGNITQARVAQNMISAGIKSNEELKVKKDEAHNLTTVINKRKNKLITNFAIKKPKKG